MKKIIVVLLMVLSLLCVSGCNNYDAEIKYTEVITISTYAEEHVYQNCGYQIINKKREDYRASSRINFIYVFFSCGFATAQVTFRFIFLQNLLNCFIKRKINFS